MAWKAVTEPMLIRERRAVIKNVSRTELSGMFQPGLTVEMKDEKGRPPSRANDHVWRDTVATVLIQAEVMLTMMMAVMMDVPALLPVTL